MREVFRLRSKEAIKAVRFSPSGCWLVVLPQSGGSIQLYERTGAIYAHRGSIAWFGLKLCIQDTGPPEYKFEANELSIMHALDRIVSHLERSYGLDLGKTTK
jgi:hypothetical protein